MTPAGVEQENAGNPQRRESVVVSVAYKGSGKKAKIQGSGAKRSQAKGLLGMTNDWNNLGAPKKSKKQSGSGGNSRKVHDTKGKNTHGRRSW